MTTILCARCEHNNRKEANYCSSCGADLRPENTQTLEHQAVSVTDAGRPTALSEAEHKTLEQATAARNKDSNASLVITEGHRSGTIYELSDEPLLIGRNPDSNIFLDDVTVSRAHAQLHHDGKVTALSDSGSLNGTYLNGSRIDTAELSHNDDIQIGKFKFRYLNE